MEIKAKTKEHPEAVTFNWDLPDALADLVAKFGEESVASNAKAAYVIGVQAFARRHIDASNLQELVDGYQPDVRQPAVKKTAKERAESAITQMSPEDRAALLEKLKALG